MRPPVPPVILGFNHETVFADPLITQLLPNFSTIAQCTAERNMTQGSTTESDVLTMETAVLKRGESHHESWLHAADDDDSDTENSNTDNDDCSSVADTASR